MCSISILIPSFNTKKATTKCIESCLNDESSAEREIIIVDNASNDGTFELLKKKYKEYKNVILIKNDKNLGFSKAVNQGFERSSGKYKYLLNSDTAITDGTLDRLIKLVESDEGIGIIGTRLILPDGSTQKSCFNFPTICNAIREFWFGQKEKYSPFYKDKLTIVDAVVGASFFITPCAYEKIRNFDERYFMYYEDIDYCRRVKKAGMKVIYTPEIIVFHHHGLSGKGLTRNSNQWRRLVPSSKIYNGTAKHYILALILWSGQKFKKITKND